MNTTVNTVHPFEKAKLGAAPFRVVAYEYMRGPVKRVENGVLVTYGSPGQPMGTCDYCGACLVHVFFVRSADDKVFRVGSDCVHKTSGKKLRTECADLVRTHRKNKRREEWQARQDQWAREAAEKAEKWREANPWWADFVFYKGDTDFGRSLEYSLSKWGELTQGQTDAAQKILAAHKTPKSEVPLSSSRLSVSGRVVKVRDDFTEFGTRRKVLLEVSTPQGSYKLWGSLPSAAYTAKPGDTLVFEARLTRSDNDDSFGFFNRPTKVTLQSA
jgi:hypothetical protein